jgi:hypothetical protein
MRYSLTLVCLLIVSPCFADNFFSVLKKDQKIGLQETANGYHIKVFKNFGVDTAPYKVIEIGDDYIVIEDAIGVNEIRIPIYSIKSITTVKFPPKAK